MLKMTDAEIDTKIAEFCDPVATYKGLHRFARSIESRTAVGLPVVAQDRIERLKAAIEGECDGLAIDDQHATAILQYVDMDAVPEPVLWVDGAALRTVPHQNKSVLVYATNYKVPGHIPLYLLPPNAASQECAAVVRELVAVQDLYIRSGGEPVEAEAIYQEWRRRKPLAWAAARALCDRLAGDTP